MTSLVDTNVVSEWMSPSPDPRAMAWLRDVDEDTVFVSAITMGELRHGVERLPRGRKRSRLDDWLSGEFTSRFDGRILHVDLAVADMWGRITARGKASGRQLQPADGLIAATALCHDLTVITRNVKDFEPSGVAVIDPWAAR